MMRLHRIVRTKGRSPGAEEKAGVVQQPLNSAIDPEIIDALREEYNFSPSEVRGIAPESRHASFFIRGSNSRQYYLKRFLPSTPHQRILRATRLSQLLRPKGIPAPKIWCTKSGKLLANSRGHLYLLTDWVEGHQVDVGGATEEIAAAIGKVVASLHRYLAVRRLRCIDWAWPPWPEIKNAWHELARECFSLATVRRDQFSEEVCALLRRHIPLLNLIPPNPPISKEVVGRVFGDLTIGQFLFGQADWIAALIDWEYAGTKGPLSDEIAGCVFRSFLTSEGQIQLPAVRAFVRSYQSMLPLPTNIWGQVFSRVCYGGHAHLAYHLQAWLRSGSADSDNERHRKLLLAYRSLVWLTEHSEGWLRVSKAWLDDRAPG